MRPPLRSLPVAALALALSAALGACGSSSPKDNGVAARPPEQIVAAAKAAADGASTVHVAGSISSEGRPLALDMELVAGQGGRGRITLDGLSIDVINAAGSIYVNGSEAFYRRIAGPEAAKLLKGKWLKAPPSAGNFASLASLTSLTALIDSTLAHHGALARGEKTTADGRRVIGVKDVSEGGTLYVATQGQPFPVEISKAGSEGGRIVFDRWDKPLTISAPADAINIKQLHK